MEKRANAGAVHQVRSAGQPGRHKNGDANTCRAGSAHRRSTTLGSAQPAMSSSAPWSVSMRASRQQRGALRPRGPASQFARWFNLARRGSRARRFSSVGTTDNSPAIHRWGARGRVEFLSPVGTAERHRCRAIRCGSFSVVPTGLWRHRRTANPSDESLGYSQSSPRDLSHDSRCIILL